MPSSMSRSGVPLALGAVAVLAAFRRLEHLSEAGSASRRPKIRTVTLPRGTLLFHGTRSTRRFTTLSGPAWVSTSLAAATQFAGEDGAFYHPDVSFGRLKLRERRSSNTTRPSLPDAFKFRTWRSADFARILIFEVKIDIHDLVLIEEKKDIDRLSKALGLSKAWQNERARADGIEATLELAKRTCAQGYAGWHVPNNYGDGQSDTLLCDPSAWLEYVRAIRRP